MAAHSHAVVKPTFWTGETGKALRSNREAQVLASYLMTCPHRAMTGLYYIPSLYICHETGMTEDEVASSFKRLDELDFARYDAAAELVFVINLAEHQVGATLKGGEKPDNRIKQIEKMAAPFRDHPFFGLFVDRYAVPYHLNLENMGAPSEGLTKGLTKPRVPAPVPDPVQTQEIDSGPAPTTAALLGREHERRYTDRRACAPTKGRSYAEQLKTAARWCDDTAARSGAPVETVVAAVLDGLFASTKKQIVDDWGMRFLGADCGEFYAPSQRTESKAPYHRDFPRSAP